MYKIFIGICLFLMSSAHSQEDKRLLLVVSCGGGGTHYTARCLQNMGIHVGHEHVESHGYVGWPFAVGPYDSHGRIVYKPPFHHTFHQVRDPLKVISTWINSGWASEIDHHAYIFIRGAIPEIKREDPTCVQCAKYWYYWNLRAEEISEWTYKVEDLANVINEFEERLNVNLDKEVMLEVPKTTGRWAEAGVGTVKVTWEYLKGNLPKDLYTNIQNMAKRYGYPIKDIDDTNQLKKASSKNSSC